MTIDVFDPIALARALHVANQGPPHWCRRSFYAAKNFILRAFARPIDRDIQRIDDQCFRCYGTGRLFGGDCAKCLGTGVYRSRRIWLDAFEFRGFRFHIPMPAVAIAEHVKPTIVGRIKHDPLPESASVAVDLAWLFNRDKLRAEVEQLVVWFNSSEACEHLPGPGAEAVRGWIRDKRLADAAAWKAETEKRVPWCPF